MPAPKGNKNAVGNAGGRPTKYSDEMLKKVQEYLDSCVDTEGEFHKTRGEKSDSFERTLDVNLPSALGLSLYLGVNEDTLYEWSKKHVEFSEAFRRVVKEGEHRMVNNAMSGKYNPLMAKFVLSSRHEYREKTDVTSGGKNIVDKVLEIKIVHEEEEK